MAVPTRALLLAAALVLLAWLYRTHDLPPSVPLWRRAEQSPAMTVPIPTIDFPPPPPIPTASGEVKIKVPPTEDRAHRHFTLPNGLEVIIVSDPKSDKAAASMDVGVGHLSDPVDLPGCAHFWYARRTRKCADPTAST
jgi:insulysin